MEKEKKPVVEVDDFDLDDDELEVSSVKENDDESDEELEEDTMDNGIDIDAIVSKAVKKSMKQIQANIDKRFDALEEQQNDTLNRVKRLENSLKVNEAEQKKGIVDSVLDTTFGTAGKLLHGVVDTTAFVAESVIDLATLGRAKRTN